MTEETIDPCEELGKKLTDAIENIIWIIKAMQAGDTDWFEGFTTYQEAFGEDEDDSIAVEWGNLAASLRILEEVVTEVQEFRKSEQAAEIKEITRKILMK